MNTTDILRSLQDLFRRHPQPWRLSAFTYYDMNDRAVSLDVCADLLATFGFDIVSLVEQCAEHGAPEDIKAAADDEIEEAKKSADAREEDLQDDLEDTEADVRRLESEVRDLERRVDELEEERNALAERVQERLS